jgi:cobalamin biosynthesis protein CobD/CbiB
VSWGVIVAGVVVLCALIAFALAFRLYFVMIGVVVAVALVATYLAGQMDKRKSRGPWAKEDGDS